MLSEGMGRSTAARGAGGGEGRRCASQGMKAAAQVAVGPATAATARALESIENNIT